MSSNVYEVPKVATSVRHNRVWRADNSEKVERQVDIYESAGAFHDGSPDHQTWAGGKTSCACQQGAHAKTSHRPCGRRWTYRDSTMALGFISLLLAIAVFTLGKLLILHHFEKSQLENRHWCDPGWTKFKCSCYFRSTEKKSWSAARADCLSRDADLVVIGNREENSAVNSLRENEDLWIGVWAAHVNGEWTWQWVNQSLCTYFSLKKDYPKPDARNGSTWYMEKTGSWRQDNDTDKQWICEKAVEACCAEE